MTLYELQDEYRVLLEMAEDPEVDMDILTDTMEALDGELEVKADGYARVLKQLEADMANLKGEEKRLATRRTAIEKSMKRMKSVLQAAMELTGKTKFKTELFSFNIQKNPAALKMDEDDLGKIPPKYLIPQDPKIDTAKLKEDLKAGKDLEGIAHLEQSMGLRIK